MAAAAIANGDAATLRTAWTGNLLVDAHDSDGCEASAHRHAVHPNEDQLFVAPYRRHAEIGDAAGLGANVVQLDRERVLHERARVDVVVPQSRTSDDAMSETGVEGAWKLAPCRPLSV